MNHDIAHCRGSECPKKDTCYRYLAYTEAMEQDMKYFSVIDFKEIDELTSVNHNCYWEYKK